MIEGTVLTFPVARDEIAKSAWPSEPREDPTRQGTGSIFISGSLKTLSTVLAHAGEAQETREGTGGKGGKQWKQGGRGEGDFPGPAPISRFPSSSLLAQSQELHLYLTLSYRPVLYQLSLLISHERFSKYMDESFVSCGLKTMLVNFNLNKTIFPMRNKKNNNCNFSN